MEYQELVPLLLQNELTLSCMESLTGGLFASTITSIPGASQVFLGGAVTYNNEIKKKFGVPSSLLSDYGAISKEVAKEMVLHTASTFQSSLAVSFTGNAGPEPSEGKEVGLVYIGFKWLDKVEVYELHLKGERNDIRRQCVDFAFQKIFDTFKIDS